MPSGTKSPPEASDCNTHFLEDTPCQTTKEGSISQQPVENTTSNRTRRPKRTSRSQQFTSTDIQRSDQDNTMQPFTPPRAILHNGERPASIPMNASLSAAMTAKGKKKGNGSQSNGHAVSSSPANRKGRTPRTEPSKHSMTMTPARPSAPPIQAYAGPTFHASPAPSSLPIPRFFAKSLASAEKPSSPGVVAQDHSSQSSSTKSEDSPTMSHSLKMVEDPTKDASPLDIFFKADREEKARRLLDASQGSENVNVGGGRSSNGYIHTQTPSEPIPNPFNCVARTVMDSPSSKTSLIGKDVKETYKIDNPAMTQGQHPTTHRSKTLPSVMTTYSETDEQRQAKTLALKRLLMSPKPQLPPSSSVNANIKTSPSPHPEKFFDTSVSLSKSALNDATPYKVPHDTQQRANFPIKQFTPNTATRPSERRTSSSYLRREFTRENLNITMEVPTTPTPYRSRNLPNQAISSNDLHAQLNRHIPLSTNACPPFKAQADIRSKPASNNGNIEMEDALRKILKLDVVGVEGATGVRS